MMEMLCVDMEIGLEHVIGFRGPSSLLSIFVSLNLLTGALE